MKWINALLVKIFSFKQNENRSKHKLNAVPCESIFNSFRSKRSVIAITYWGQKTTLFSMYECNTSTYFSVNQE